MLDTLKNGINSVLLWIIGGVANIANSFSIAAVYAGDIPVVGAGLKSALVNIQSFFNDLGYDIAHFHGYLNDILDTISEWLDIVADLASDVNQWISEGISEISFDLAALKDTVVAWVREQIQEIILDIDEIKNVLWPGFYAEASNTWLRLLDLIDYVFSGGWIQDVSNWVAHAVDAVVGYITTDLIPSLQTTLKEDIFQFIAPVYNLVETFFEDISSFFSDPAAYYTKKLEEGGSSFADGLWNIIEKILELIW